MDIQVNGESQTLPEGLTVKDLLHSLDIRIEQVAVELNLKIIDRCDFAHSVLQNGDTVEIISFMGGGTDGTSLQDMLPFTKPVTAT